MSFRDSKIDSDFNSIFTPIGEKEKEKDCIECGKILEASRYRSENIIRNDIKGVLRVSRCRDCEKIDFSKKLPGDPENKQIKELQQSIKDMKIEFVYAINHLRKELEDCKNERKKVLYNSLSEGLTSTRRMTLPNIDHKKR